MPDFRAETLVRNPGSVMREGQVDSHDGRVQRECDLKGTDRERRYPARAIGGELDPPPLFLN